jgi:hypothetical protein
MTAFVEDLPLGKQPLAIGLNQFVFIMPKPVEDAATVRVVVGVVEPVRDALRLVAVDLDDDVRNIVARRPVAFSGNRGRLGHSRDHILDRLAAFDIAAAVVEDAVRSEGRHIEPRMPVELSFFA